MKNRKAIFTSSPSGLVSAKSANKILAKRHEHCLNLWCRASQTEQALDCPKSTEARLQSKFVISITLYEMPVTAPSDNTAWIVLMFNLPTTQASQRVEVWRKLKRYGALPLESGG